MTTSRDYVIWLFALAVIRQEVLCQTYDIDASLAYDRTACALNSWSEYSGSVTLKSKQQIDEKLFETSEIKLHYNYPKDKHLSLAACLPNVQIGGGGMQYTCARRYVSGVYWYAFDITFRIDSYDYKYTENALTFSLVIGGKDVTLRRSPTLKLPKMQARLSASYWIYPNEKIRDKVGISLYSYNPHTRFVSANKIQKEKLTFCILGLRSPNDIQFGDREFLIIKDESPEGTCVSKDIDLQLRTAYHLFYKERYYCWRRNTFILYLSACDNLFSLLKTPEIRYSGDSLTGDVHHDTCSTLADRWAVDFLLLLSDGCFQGLIHIDAVNSDVMRIITIKTEDCEKGLDEHCTYKPYGREKSNTRRYLIHINQTASRRLSERRLWVSVPRADGLNVSQFETSRDLGTLREMTYAINANFQISGQRTYPLLKRQEFVHVTAKEVEQKQIKFCADADEILLNGERSTESCISQNIDLGTRTAHRMSYSEFTGCERQATYTRFLTCCECLRYTASAMTYIRDLPDDSCLLIVGQDSWTIFFVLDLPDDCFKTTVTVMAHSVTTNDKPLVVSVLDTAKCHRGEEVDCVYREPPPERENIRRYAITIKRPAIRALSEHILYVSLLSKYGDRLPEEGKLGRFPVIADVVRGAYMIPGIHENFVELAEDQAVEDAAYTETEVKAQVTFCVNFLLGEVTARILGHDGRKTSNNCVTAVMPLQLGVLEMSYRESYRPCADRRGVFYLKMTRQPADKPPKLPVFPGWYPSRPDSAVNGTDSPNIILPDTPQPQLNLSPKLTLAVVGAGFLVAIFTIGYCALAGGSVKVTERSNEMSPSQSASQSARVEQPEKSGKSMNKNSLIKSSASEISMSKKYSINNSMSKYSSNKYSKSKHSMTNTFSMSRWMPSFARHWAGQGSQSTMSTLPSFARRWAGEGSQSTIHVTAETSKTTVLASSQDISIF